MIKVAIIDDDRDSIALLQDALSGHSDVEITTVATDLVSGASMMRKDMPDLLFLDIEFPDENGVEWLEKSGLPGNLKVVFYTSYRRYIHQAMRIRIFDFLLKPLEKTDLDLILGRFRLEYNAMPYQNAPVCTTRDASTGSLLSITTITNDKMIMPPSCILYFRYDSERKLWEVVTTACKRYILKRHTTAESILNYGDKFVRTHKVFIINLDYLGMISGSDCILLPPYDTINEIKISKNYRRPLLDRFYDL